MRREATPAERSLWRALREIELPHGHFRRQAPIGPYFSDFAHHGLRLVVELDGDQHGRAEGLRRDEVRTAYLERAGYRVLRFWNHEVRDNLSGVVETIMAAWASPLASSTTEHTREGATAAEERNPVSLPPLALASGGEGLRVGGAAPECGFAEHGPAELAMLAPTGLGPAEPPPTPSPSPPLASPAGGGESASTSQTSALISNEIAGTSPC